jgi:hypothetical protein
VVIAVRAGVSHRDARPARIILPHGFHNTIVVYFLPSLKPATVASIT